MSYGYEPPKQGEEGSWGEVWAITKVAFGLLIPAMLFILGAIVFIVVAIWLFLTHPALGLIPAAAIALGVWWLARRDRRIQDEERRRIEGGS